MSDNHSQYPNSDIPLLYADTARSADMLYFGAVDVPDPFIAFLFQGKKYAVLNKLEFARVRRDGKFDVVWPLESFHERWRQLHPDKRPQTADVVELIATDLGIEGFLVPFDFPTGLALEISEKGIDVGVAEGMLFPERAFKSDGEAECIREGNSASAAGFRIVETILRAAVIDGDRLLYQGQVLTSERLREEIEIVCLRRGAHALNTIVAGGDQGCDPHCRGSGPLRPHELIIVDIFPRIARTGFHGDMTRTYLKGKASEAQTNLVDAVFQTQQSVLRKHAPGINGRELYQYVVDTFNQRGYRTETIEGISTGFFHGLGHGLGLEVHEPPRVSALDADLKIGHVVTVEPGLYYPGLGGCRIEDVVRITQDGYELLSEHPYDWLIA